MNLSKHFTFEELTVSDAAARRGIPNVPEQEEFENLQYLAVKLEEVRQLLGEPMLISSGYRSPDTNFIIGGSKNSQHMKGQAVDFICPAVGDPYEICSIIDRSGILYDQLIHEYGRWVHISFVKEKPRREVLTICTAKQGYRRGIFKCQT